MHRREEESFVIWFQGSDVHPLPRDRAHLDLSGRPISGEISRGDRSPGRSISGEIEIDQTPGRSRPYLTIFMLDMTEILFDVLSDISLTVTEIFG
jgi:hypothetical protein